MSPTPRLDRAAPGAPPTPATPASSPAVPAASRARAARTPVVVGDPVTALEQALLVASSPARDETVCLLLDGDYGPHTALVVTGRGDVVELAGLVARTAAPQPGAGGRPVAVVVLVTVQPGRGHVPGDDEVRAWFRMRRRLGTAGLVLADWFLVDGDRAGSVAELTDTAPRWRRS